MSVAGEQNTLSFRRRVVRAVRARFSLKDDRDDDADIDLNLRAGVVMKGTNLWVLMLAILVASIGLNVNSTAVVIGAMLISPLMGPIMGVGYGVGIYDFALIRRALKNLGIATLLALATSTVYFLISPLTTMQSELLARTTPTIWDVLIASFGGLAGIIAATRKEKSIAISGVAIATALMPPLCTAGFGLANANWQAFLGAFYLFTINCVFIAASSAIIVKAFRMPHKFFVDKHVAIRVHRYLGMTAVLTILPSLYLAYQLVEEEIFKSKAIQFVHTQLEFKQSHVVDIKIDPKTRRIEATLVGEIVPQSTLTDVRKKLQSEGLNEAELKVYQTGDQRIDVVALKSNLLGELYRGNKAALEANDKNSKTIEQLHAELSSLKERQQRFKDIPSELHALYPQIKTVSLSEAPDWNAETGWGAQNTVILSVRSLKVLKKDDQAKILQWLRTRLKQDVVRLAVEIEKL